MTSLGDDLWKKQKDSDDNMRTSCRGVYLDDLSYETRRFVVVLSKEKCCLFLIGCVESSKEVSKGLCFI